MNYFYDELEKLPGLKPVRANNGDTITGAFYSPLIAYFPNELGGLSAKRFAEAVLAEFNGTYKCRAGGNNCLHTHEYFRSFEPLNNGKKDVVKKVREIPEELRASEDKFCVSAPWFKNLNREWIDLYVKAYKKVVDNYEELLEGDDKSIKTGIWYAAEKSADKKEK
jgi:hypothetical protein